MTDVLRAFTVLAIPNISLADVRILPILLGSWAFTVRNQQVGGGCHMVIIDSF